ncbi:nicotinamide riboside transporter PnuC [Mollicutes bacterium LVI A0039]|nr:nicotinamide riboside transporter PnuC [Mollicutes bacterium LVI A0039]
MLTKLTFKELALWVTSITVIVLSNLFISDTDMILTITSCIGVSALIWIAKRNLLGQVLQLIFCIAYGIISFNNMYYGEFITYVFMTGPSALITLIIWSKNCAEDGVDVEITSMKTITIVGLAAVVTTFIMYYILVYFNTASIVLSTISITTSVFAAMLMMYRSKFYAIAYAANDIVLICIWGLASIQDIQYISLVFCFIIFFINDLYGYYSWEKAEKQLVTQLSEA